MLGFLAASVIGTLYVAAVGATAAKPVIATVNDLRTLFLILAFVSIGLEFRVAPLREAGWRPVGVFAGATVVNLLVGLLLATLLFSGFPPREGPSVRPGEAAHPAPAAPVPMSSGRDPADPTSTEQHHDPSGRPHPRDRRGRSPTSCSSPSTSSSPGTARWRCMTSTSSCTPS